MKSTFETIKIWLNKLRFALAAKVLRARIVRAFARTPAYRRYLEAQIAKSFKQKERHAARIPAFVGVVSHALPVGERGSLLAVGCRSGYELDELLRAGFAPVVGIDLFSADARITVMDMHRMRFPDAQFDVLYSCHSLEHNFNREAALREFTRVVRPGGFIAVEVPVRFTPSESDRDDFGSAEGLRAAFAPYTHEVLLCEEFTDHESGGTSARLIARRA